MFGQLRQYAIGRRQPHPAGLAGKRMNFFGGHGFAMVAEHI